MKFSRQAEKDSSFAGLVNQALILVKKLWWPSVSTSSHKFDSRAPWLLTTTITLSKRRNWVRRWTRLTCPLSATLACSCEIMEWKWALVRRLYQQPQFLLLRDWDSYRIASFSRWPVVQEALSNCFPHPLTLAASAVQEDGLVKRKPLHGKKSWWSWC